MGAVSSIVFAKRNADKAANGDIGRAPIPAFQLMSATAGVATIAETAGFTKVSNGMNSVFSKTDKIIEKSGATKKICNGIDTIFGKSDELLKKTTSSSEKICLGAGKMVNGLLIGASAIRVLKDKDKKSAVVEEGFAMSSMFAGEAVFKGARKALVNSIQNSSAVAVKADLNSCKAMAKNISASNIKGVLKGISNGKYGKWVKLAGVVAADLAFVATSIFCFDMGKKIGKKITGRDQKEQVAKVSDILKQPMRPLVGPLAVKA